MELEEAIQTLKDFAEEKIQQDKLEHYRGSYKMGYFYMKDVQSAINDLLNHLAKQEKMIDTIITELAYYDNYICHSIECKDIGCKECLKQYFEKKAEESK